MSFNPAGNYFDNLNQLCNADPEVFGDGGVYARIAQRSAGRQPILVTSEGLPVDGNPRHFIGEAYEYRGNFYASVNKDFPYVALCAQVNANGLQMPICKKRKS